MATLLALVVHLNLVILTHQFLAGSVSVHAVRTAAFGDFVGGFVVDTRFTHSCAGTSLTSFHVLRTLLALISDLDFVSLADQLFASSVAIHAMGADTLIDQVGGLIIDALCAGVVGRTLVTAFHQL